MSDKKNVVVIGGGTGTVAILDGLKQNKNLDILSKESSLFIKTKFSKNY